MVGYQCTKKCMQRFLRVLTIGKLETDTTRWLQPQKKLQLEMRSSVAATLPILLANGRIH
jgi:hypothetical protein